MAVQRSNSPVEEWSIDDVVSLLKENGLGHYAESFRANAINGRDLIDLTETDMTGDLGMTKLQAKKVLRLVQEHQERVGRGGATTTTASMTTVPTGPTATTSNPQNSSGETAYGIPAPLPYQPGAQTAGGGGMYAPAAGGGGYQTPYGAPPAGYPTAGGGYQGNGYQGPPGGYIGPGSQPPRPPPAEYGAGAGMPMYYAPPNFQQQNQTPSPHGCSIM